MTGKRRTADPKTERVTVDSDDDHTVTVTPVGDDWNATAACDLCPWTGSGGSDALLSLAVHHAEGSDGSRDGS